MLPIKCPHTYALLNSYARYAAPVHFKCGSAKEKILQWRMVLLPQAFVGIPSPQHHFGILFEEFCNVGRNVLAIGITSSSKNRNEERIQCETMHLLYSAQ
jgi:hypothetical protein